MGERTVQVEVFEKKGDFHLKTQSLKPAWLRESGEAVDADRVFIWGKGARQRPHINGSGQRPTLSPNYPQTLLTDFYKAIAFLGELTFILQNLRKPRDSYKFLVPIITLKRESERLSLS